MLSLFDAGVLINEFSVSWIRGFGSRLLISQGFLGAKAPLQSVFAKDTAFLSAKAQKLQKAQLFAIVDSVQ